MPISGAGRTGGRRWIVPPQIQQRTNLYRNLVKLDLFTIVRTDNGIKLALTPIIVDYVLGSSGMVNGQKHRAVLNKNIGKLSTKEILFFLKIKQEIKKEFNRIEEREKQIESSGASMRMSEITGEEEDDDVMTAQISTKDIFDSDLVEDAIPFEEPIDIPKPKQHDYLLELAINELTGDTTIVDRACKKMNYKL